MSKDWFTEDQLEAAGDAIRGLRSDLESSVDLAAAALRAINPYQWKPDDEQLKCGARAIGRTIHSRNHDDRIREVVRSMNERDDSWPSSLPPSLTEPTNE